MPPAPKTWRPLSVSFTSGWLGRFRIVVIVVERDVFVIALDQPAAGSVVARGGQQQRGIFAERELRLHEALAEACLADDQAAIVILNGAGDDFRSRRALAVDQHDERNLDALIAAHRIVAAFRRRAAAMRNHELILFEEHVRHADGLIQQAAAVAAQVDDQSVELAKRPAA